MAFKLEITKDLESLGEKLENPDLVAILNLPDANLCDKRKEFVLREGKLEQACKGCVTQRIKVGEMIDLGQIREAIDYFGNNYGTRWITINGRGDPFHPKLRERTLEKIRYAGSKGIRAYVFTAGNNLDEEVCRTLAENNANVMISLYGNSFIDKTFFEGRKYASPINRIKALLASNAPEKAVRFGEKGLLQDEAKIADNLRRLIDAVQSNHTSEETARIAVNYVVTPGDILDDGRKIAELKDAANNNKVGFFCNLEFEASDKYDAGILKQLRQLKEQHSTSEHSTSVNGQCQMGAGSSTTIDYNGDMYRCPYMSGGGDGNFFAISKEERDRIIADHVGSRNYSCGMRKTLRRK